MTASPGQVTTVNALPVVLELVRDDDPRVRRNAVTALGAIGTDESVEAVARTALEDPDISVRTRAEEELVSLRPRPESFSVARHAIEARLKDREHGPAAYAVLGRLSIANLSNWPLEQRFAWSARFRPRGGHSIGQGIGFSVIGSLVAGLVVATALWIAGGGEPGSPMYGVVLATAMIIAPVLGLVTNVFSYPYGVYPDPVPGGVVATARAAGLPILLFVFGMLVAMDNGTAVVKLFAAGIAAAIATRIATIVAYGIFGGRILNTLTQAVVGTAAGMVVVMAGYFWIRPLDPHHPVSVHDTALVLIGSMAGIASAVAALDNRVQVQRRTTSQVRIVFSALTVFLASVPFGAVAFFELTRTLAAPEVELTAGRKTFDVTRLPFDATIRLPAAGSVVVTADDCAFVDQMHCMVTLYSKAGQTIGGPAVPPQLEATLEKNEYRLVYAESEPTYFGVSRDREVKWFVTRALSILPDSLRTFLGSPPLTLNVAYQPGGVSQSK